MTEPDVLTGQIHELKEWQRVAWQRIADPLLTAFERREIRNHIRESEGDLRRHLAMMSEWLRDRPRLVEDVGYDEARPKFRLLA
jgi:F420-0:gamma-glutamyl ligase-like protein